MLACQILIRVQPRAARDEIVAYEGGVLRVRLTAPPVDDRANAALMRFLAGRLDVPPSAVAPVAGGRSRLKRVAIDGLSLEEAIGRLRP